MANALSSSSASSTSGGVLFLGAAESREPDPAGQRAVAVPRKDEWLADETGRAAEHSEAGDITQEAAAPRTMSDDRRSTGVPSRSMLVSSDWRWRLMQWLVPAIATWCVAEVYLGTNGIKVTVTSVVGLFLMLAWVLANVIRHRFPEDALKITDGALFLAAAVLIGQFCFAATKNDEALLQLAIQDLIIWAPLASGLSAFAYARKSWVPVAVTAGTYAALSAGTFFFRADHGGAYQLPLHGLIIQAMGIMAMGVFFNRLRESVSLTIARLRLAEEQSHIDTLTGLFNRRKFDLDWSRVCAERPGACLLLLDVDHFKKVNDDFGHAAGDRVLSAVGKLLAASVNGKGSAYRWGGEEFALIIHGGRLHARLIAQKVMTDVSLSRLDIGRPVTLSAGLSVAIAEESPAAIFQHADDALLEAKRTGRNRLVCASGDGPLTDIPSSFLQPFPGSPANDGLR